MFLSRRSCPLAFVSFRGGAGKRQVSVRIDQTRYRETAHVYGRNVLDGAGNEPPGSNPQVGAFSQWKHGRIYMKS
jgi:hypothetical protein